MITTAKWYSGTLSFLTFVLQVRKNPEKTSLRNPVPIGDRTWARCVTSAHATTCSTAVDRKNNSKYKNAGWQESPTCDLRRVRKMFRFNMYFLFLICCYLRSMYNLHKTTAAVEGSHRCLLPSGPRFDPRLGQLSWLRFFSRVFPQM